MGDYFDYGTGRRGNATDPNRLNAPLPATPGGGRGQARPAPSLESLRAPSSIRIRRLPSGNVPQYVQQRGPTTPAQDTAVTGRRRSTSAPQRYGNTLAPPTADLTRQRTAEEPGMSPLAEEPTASSAHYASSESTQDYQDAAQTPTREHPTNVDRVVTGASAMEDAGNAARSNRGLSRFQTAASTRYAPPAADEYNNDVVDLLDLVDPEVRTLGTLTNVQNSLFIPDLGGLVNRRPTYTLTERPSSAFQSAQNIQRIRSRQQGTGAARPPSALSTIPQESQTEDIELQPAERRFSISSNLSDSRYAVLPHGVSLEGWAEEDKAELDDHVRHLMHSRKEGFKRSMKGFKQYISKPLGLFVFVYAVLVTLFGAAWVFFLIGWIYVGDKQGYIINIVDNVLVALFALMGDGLAPFRTVDTYHMCFIAKYHHRTWEERKKKNLPELIDHNDLPDRRASQADVDLEAAADKDEQAEFSVLTMAQHRRLQYHQAKFGKAHTFYRPHETATHHAFPLRLMIAAVVLLDCHSLFQVALGTCTWSIDHTVRPEALTATILSFSICCNIAAGIVISIGDHRTRKKDVLERINRQNLTEEALERMAKSRKSEEIMRKSMEVSRTNAQMAEERKEQEIAPTMMVHTPTNEGQEKKMV